MSQIWKAMDYKSNMLLFTMFRKGIFQSLLMIMSFKNVSSHFGMLSNIDYVSFLVNVFGYFVSISFTSKYSKWSNNSLETLFYKGIKHSTLTSILNPKQCKTK
jgi:hypothetical protein